MQFLLLGLGPGAVYGALGIGLLLTYRSSGVVNFAHGAMAMFAAYDFVGLRLYGDLLLPLPGPPGRVHVGVLPTLPAAVIAVVVTAALQLALYWMVFRPLRTAPALARVVASVGLMVALQALVTLQFGADSIAVPPILPGGAISLAGIRIPADRLYLTACVAVTATALWALGRFTRFGLASRAIAENETAVGLLGWSPNAVAAANWVLAGVLAALAGILVGPITTADPLTFSLLVVPALAAALVARFASFAVTVVTGLAVGMLQSELLEVQVHAAWLPASGIGKAIPLVLVIGVAAVRGALLPTRSTQIERRLPVVGRPVRPVASGVALFVVGVVGLSLTHGEIRLSVITSIIGAVVCLSIVLLTGFLGQLSLAQMAFAGVAGFTLSRLQHDLGVPFPLDAMSAALLAAVAGLLIGASALRVRGPALAVATLAGGLAVEALIFQDPRLTGGLAGSRVRAPSIAGTSLGPGSGGAGYPRLAFGVLALLVLCLSVAGVSRLRSSALGRRMLAVRANERAAEAAAVAVARTKLVGFTLSALLAGFAGALLGWQQGQLSFGSFGVFVSLAYVAVTYVGGVGRVSGALVGGALIANGVVFTALDNTFGVGRYQLLVSGVAVVVSCVVAPDGLTGSAVRAVRRLAARP